MLSARGRADPRVRAAARPGRKPGYHSMDQSRSSSGGGSEQASSQDHRHSEDERRWQQERLSREEAYYQFINELNDEDYRLMRDHNLLGTPGEITSEELQQRLDGAKEHLASQPDLENRQTEGGTLGDAEIPRDSSNGDSLLEWLNTFRRTGNATRSGQSGNQTWRAVSRTNPNSGEFRFSLEININHENNGFEAPNDEYASVSHSHASRNHPGNGHQREVSPVARRTRSQTSVTLNGDSLRVPRTRMARSSRRRNSVEMSFSMLGRVRSRNRGSVSVTRANSVNDNLSGHANPRGTSEYNIREGLGASSQLQGNRRRTPVPTRSASQRQEPANLESAVNSRSRSPVQRQSDAMDSEEHNSHRENRPSQQTFRRSVRRRHVAHVYLEPAGEHRGTAHTPLSNSGLLSRITVEGEESIRPTAAVRRHPTITLDLQVRRIRPGENRDRDSIANRTRSRVGLAENTVTFESNSGGFRRTISRSERAGIRTYVSTIRIPLRRISENGLGEPSSVALRSILRQIMTGFGELSSLMETESESEFQRSGQHLREMHSEVSNSHAVDGSQQNEVSFQERQAQEGNIEMSGENERTQSNNHNNENRENRQSQDANNLVESGTLPILRLAHFFLLNEDDDDEHFRGLTKEQIDNLSTRNFGDIESELSKTCSVCINEYVTGNKLRQLPCMHEFHIHCIDRWLSENCTCPICRQPVLGSNIADNG
uniref:RING-type E3 ubiquitin transferase n=2 Tax=Phascolarctos cinereus TaxID=38626 RepID=A0A6P5L433_PHACI|nr:E3 ubiquitin-protein ligase RNF6 isoform X1 [Phascolarctos cinereus]